MARHNADSDSDDTDDSVTRQIDDLSIDDDLPDAVETPGEQASIKDFQKVSMRSHSRPL